MQRTSYCRLRVVTQFRMKYDALQKVTCGYLVLSDALIC